jgi:hypothetical protein
VTSVELRYEGNNVIDCGFEVSVNDGSSWEEISRNTLKTITNIGTNLKFRVNRNTAGSTIPEFDWISLLYTDE